MLRRLHTTGALRSGPVQLDRDEAHHARDVLRLGTGDAVELFDDAGAVGRGVIERCDAQAVVARVEAVDRNPGTVGITIASAVPKGERADWMVEKLSELGVERFVPLVTARGVVLPAGKNKRDRWRRIATEAAKQSRRAGVMRIEELTELSRVVGSESAACYLDTGSDAGSLIDHLVSQSSSQITLFVGPEGGWTRDEIELMRGRGLTSVRLTATILRVETAAVAAAAIVACWHARPRARATPAAPGA